jgi:hypothetical protein
VHARIDQSIARKADQSFDAFVPQDTGDCISCFDG